MSLPLSEYVVAAHINLICWYEERNRKWYEDDTGKYVSSSVYTISSAVSIHVRSMYKSSFCLAQKAPKFTLEREGFHYYILRMNLCMTFISLFSRCHY